MKYILLAFIGLSTFTYGQLSVSEPIALTGYAGSARTVHFTADEKMLYTDWEDLVQWSIAERKVVNVTPIPGYNTYKSSFIGDSLWVIGNSNYNTSKKDISDMHSNLNVWNTVEMKSIKTRHGYGVGALIPGTSDAIMVYMNKQYQYEIKRLNTLTQEEKTFYFSENRDGSAVPTALKISSNGEAVAVALAGEGSGMRVYRISDAKQLAIIPTKGDANDISFSGNGKYVYFNQGSMLVQVNAANWGDAKKWDIGKPIYSLDASPDGKYVVVALQNKGAILFDTSTGAIVKSLTNGKVIDVTYSPGGKYIALGMQKTLMSKDVATVLLFEVG